MQSDVNARALPPVQSPKHLQIQIFISMFFQTRGGSSDDASDQECGQKENADHVLFRLNHLSGCQSGGLGGGGGGGSDVWVHCMELAQAKQSDFQQ
ncbi:hypothetical protein PAMP_005320 [Pampus punctatissimus]